MTVKVEAEALDTSLTQRGSQWPVPSAVLMRAVEENEAAYGLNTIRARPVSLVQVGHALVVSATEPLPPTQPPPPRATLRGNHADMWLRTLRSADTRPHERDTTEREKGVSHKTYSVHACFVCLSLTHGALIL